MSAARLVEHFFRHEYGRLVATLVRRVGVQHIEAIEDAVQSALSTALATWTNGHEPQNPSAWLFRVAQNNLLSKLRQTAGRRRILAQNAAEIADVFERNDEPGPLSSFEHVPDDLLRLLFACCTEEIPEQSQLILALKSLCGFDIREIALRLFVSEANVYKRLSRARSCLREVETVTELSLDQYAPRLPAVRRVLYVLFTEGYLSSHTDTAIRRELCQEAIRLTTILAEHPVGGNPETFALLALMHLHSARLSARQNNVNELMLLEEQDRTLWHQEEIQRGLVWLARSAEGDDFTRYHAEAGISAEHCLAQSFRETRWDRIAECYALLEQIAPSPLHRLNRAVAVAEWKGPAAGLAILDDFDAPAWLRQSYLWPAVQADLRRRTGDAKAAADYLDTAINSAPSRAVRALLRRRLLQS